MIQDTTLSYLAGFVDGDGSIGVCLEPKTRGRWGATPFLSISNVNPTVPHLCRLLFGGKCYLRVPKEPSRKPIWKWDARGTRAYQVVAQLYPYLSQKRPQAENLLDFWEYWQRRLKYWRKIPLAFRVLYNRERDEVLGYLARSKDLNQRGIRHN